MQSPRILSSTLCASLFALTACGGGSGGSSNSVSSGNTPAITPPTTTTTQTAPAFAQCASPLPQAVESYTITSNLPNSFDQGRTDDATEQPTTMIPINVLLPERCPGDVFPLVVEGHGYSGSKETAINADAALDSTAPHFPSVDDVATSLPYYGYVVISLDQRGHGENIPDNGGGYARAIDPQAETQDAIAVLDFAWDNAALFQLQTEPDTGIAKDLKVGLIGYSYGGGFQMPWAAIDPRIDTIVPNGTWHSFIYSLLPGNAVKSSYDALLCLLASTGGVSNTPILATLCETVGITGLQAGMIRTRQDLIDALATSGIAEEEVVEGLFAAHGMDFFEARELAGEAWCTPGDTGCSSDGSPFQQRSVPTLLLQGNRDVLFNMTDAYWNWQYFKNAANGAPVRLLTTEGGHMNPLANQVEGTANCGGIIGVDSIKAWFDFHLLNVSSSAYSAIPEICISVADTEGAESAPAVGVTLNDMPIGSQTGAGAVPARLETADVLVAITDVEPVFLPVATISGDDKVLAGIISLEGLTVSANSGTLTPVAYMGTGIVRGGTTILVDDQVTAYVEGSYTQVPEQANNDRVLLAGVGEQLQDGDQVGVLFYQNHPQYTSLISTGSLGGAGGLAGFVLGVELPPIDLPSINTNFNPYSVSVTGLEVPIIVPGTFAGSALVTP